MRFLVDLASAMAVAALFAGAGELVLFRPSRSIRSFFEAFAVGSAVAAALLFPLSLVAGRHALGLMAIMLAGCFLAALALRLTTHRISEARSSGPGINYRDSRSLAFLALIVAGWSCFALLNWRMGFLWDGFETWASRAQMLFVEGRLAPDRFPEASHIRSKIRYPPLLPMYEALVAVLQRQFDFDRFKPIFLVFFSGMLVMTYSAVRTIGTSRLALAITAIVALSSPLSSNWAAGGYADMPLAFYVAALTAAVLRQSARSGGISPVPWLMGALCFVKAEGLILAAIVVSVAALYWLIVKSGEPLRSRILEVWPAIVIVSSMIFLRLAYLRWIDYRGSIFLSVKRETIPAILERMPEVTLLFGRYLFSPHTWALFWPTFFAALIVVFVKGTHRQRAIGASVLLALGAYSGAFLLTTWDIEILADQTLLRLLAQVVPAAAIVMGIAFQIAMTGKIRGDQTLPCSEESEIMPYRRSDREDR